jgi:WD40 repeat protein
MAKDWIATSGWDRRLRLWSRDTLKLLAEYQQPAPHGPFFWELLWMGQEGIGVRLDNLAGSQLLFFPLINGLPDLSQPQERPFTRYLPNNQGIWTLIEREGETRLHGKDFKGKSLWKLSVPGSAWASVFSADGRSIFLYTRASQHQPHQLQQLELATGTVLQNFELTSSSSPVLFAADPTGRVLAGCSDDFVKLWDLGSGKQLFDEDQRHSSCISQGAFDVTGESLITSGWDRTLRMWDLRELLGNLPAPAIQVSTLAPPPTPVVRPPSPEAASAEELLLAGYFAEALAAYKQAPLEVFKQAPIFRMLDRCCVWRGLVRCRKREKNISKPRTLPTVWAISSTAMPGSW